MTKGSEDFPIFTIINDSDTFRLGTSFVFKGDKLIKQFKNHDERNGFLSALNAAGIEYDTYDFEWISLPSMLKLNGESYSHVTLSDMNEATTNKYCHDANVAFGKRLDARRAALIEGLASLGVTEDENKED